MELRSKLIIAFSISFVVLVGLIFLLVREPAPPPMASMGEPQPTEPESAPPETPVAAGATLEEARETPAPSSAAPKTFRPLLAVGGWKLTGRIVRLSEELLQSDGGGQLPGAEPIAGVRIRLKPHPRRPTDNPIAVHERVTAPDGLFEFAGVPGDAYLRLEIDDPRSAYRTLSFRLGEPGAEGIKDLGDVPVEPGARLTFHVQGPGGAPVPQANLLVNVASSNPRRSRHLANLGISESRRRAEELEPGIYVLDRAAGGDMYAEVGAPGHAPSGRVDFASPREEPLVISLEEGYTIAGAVLDLDGRPIVAAELETGPSGNRDRVTSDEEGRFLFDSLGAGEHSIAVNADGYVSHTERNVPVGTGDLRFALAPEAIVAGKVLAQDGGEPAPQARVTLIEQTTRSSHRADSKEDGSFEIRGVPAGTFNLTVDHASFAPKSVEEPLTLETGDRRDVGSILLVEGIKATGRILESESDAPVAGAEVTFALQGGGSSSPVSRRVDSDAEGRYETKGLSEGTYVVTVKAKGYLDGKPRPVTVEEEGERSFDFRLELGSAIEGKVVDPAGKPIAGASVRPNISVMQGEDWSELNENFNNIFNIQVQTDTEGRYRIDGLRPYASYSVEASHSDYARAKAPRLDLQPRSTLTDVVLTLKRGGSVSGRVLDSDGSPISGANVTASIERRYDPAEGQEWVSFGNNRSSRTDESGSYRLEHLAEGTYTVQAQKDGLAPASREGVAIADEKEAGGIDLELSEGLTLTGRVVDMDGAPLARVRIWVYDQSSRQAETDADGRFQVEGLRAGQKHLQASLSGYVSMSESINLPAGDDFVITLEGSVRVRGRVVADPPGAFTTFQLISTSLDGDGRGNTGRQFRDATGNFELELGPGRYQLVAMVKGYAPSKSGEFTVAAGETVEGIEIELLAGGRIEGVVVDRATGEAVANARLALQPSGRDDSYLGWGGAPSGRSDDEGNFVIDGLPIDTVTLQVTHPSYAQHTVPGIVVGLDQAAVVRVELGGGGGLHGVVTRDGKPVQGVSIHAYRQSSTPTAGFVSKSAQTSAEGRYEMKGLPEGQYGVSLSFPGSGRNLSQTTTIADGQSTELNFHEAAGIRISGRVYEGGAPVSGGNIMAMHPTKGFTSNSSIDASGNYSLEVAGPGTYSLMFRWSGRGETGARVEVDVPAGRNQVEFDIDLPGGAVVGTVVDAETGAPISRATAIALLPSQATESFMSLFRSVQSMGQTDGQGQFAIRNVAEGTYTVRVFAEGYADGRIDRVRVSRGKTNTGDIPLERGVPFRVHVSSPDGKPLAGALVLLRDRFGSLVGLMRPRSTNSQGVAEVPSVTPGDYRVTVTHASYAPATIEARVEAGGQEPEVRLEPGGELTVRVVDSRGRAAAQAEIYLLDASGRNVLDDRVDFRVGPAQGNLADGRGVLTLANVKPGAYRALASLSGRGRSEEVDVEVERGRPAQVELELKE